MIVGSGTGVRVAMEARAVATASSMVMLGVATARPGREQDEINSPRISIIKKDRSIRIKLELKLNFYIPLGFRLYSF